MLPTLMDTPKVSELCAGKKNMEHMTEYSMINLEIMLMLHYRELKIVFMLWPIQSMELSQVRNW